LHHNSHLPATQYTKDVECLLLSILLRYEPSWHDLAMILLIKRWTVALNNKQELRAISLALTWVLWKAGSCWIPMISPGQDTPLVSHLDHDVRCLQVNRNYVVSPQRSVIKLNNPLVFTPSGRGAVELLGLIICHNLSRWGDHITKLASKAIAV